MATAASPTSSPRLPSPPPIAEDQLGPKSPTAGLLGHGPQLGIGQVVDHGASRRIRPGTKSADMPEGPPVIDIAEIDTAYQLTEHLKALYNEAINPKNSENTVPVDRPTAQILATPPKDIDRAIWLYELCRFLCQKVNGIIVALFADDPPCSALTCSEMRASEWQYLCAVHDPPKACCAIDYCCHTLDWAANVLTSQKHFPSRMTLGPEQGASHQQMRQLTNIFRRVYRIFAHAWFQHRDTFWKVESRTGLYVFFKTVCDVYNLIPEDNYTVPPEAEGKEPEHDEFDDMKELPSILIRPDNDRLRDRSRSPEKKDSQPPQLAGNLSISTGHTTKRHLRNPSADSGIISTVLEENEDDGESISSKSVAETVIGSDPQSQTAASILEKAHEPISEKTNLSSEPPTEEDDVTVVEPAQEEAPVEKVSVEEVEPEVTEPVDEVTDSAAAHHVVETSVEENEPEPAEDSEKAAAPAIVVQSPADEKHEAVKAAEGAEDAEDVDATIVGTALESSDVEKAEEKGVKAASEGSKDSSTKASTEEEAQKS